MAGRKGNPDKVNGLLARQAWELAKGDRKAVYSRYIQLHWRATGRLAPGCDSRDLQAWLERNLGVD